MPLQILFPLPEIFFPIPSTPVWLTHTYLSNSSLSSFFPKALSHSCPQLLKVNYQMPMVYFTSSSLPPNKDSLRVGLGHLTFPGPNTDRCSLNIWQVNEEENINEPWVFFSISYTISFSLEIFFFVHHPCIDVVSGEHLINRKYQNWQSPPIFHYFSLKTFKPAWKGIVIMWSTIDLSVYTHPLTGKQNHAQNSMEEIKVDGHRCIWIRMWINYLKCNLLAITRPTIINYFWTTNITWDCPGQTRTCGHFQLRPAHIGVFGSESMKTKLHFWGR